MCKASFADGIQNYLGFGDIWMIPYWKRIKDTWNTCRLAVFLTN